MASKKQLPKQDKDRDTLLSDLMSNVQLQLTLMHDQQTEMGNNPHPPSAKRAQLNGLNRKIIEAQLELREMIVRFNREFVNNDLVIPINYSDSNPPSSIRNSIRVVKDNKSISALVVTILGAIVALLLRHYGLE